eukprot:scaffold910_cov396-Prasinococcus_capsulatus_cf.AAC.29
MRGADVNAETKDSQKRPLFFAAASGSLECAKTCIDSGAEVDHTDAFGICALRCVSRPGQTRFKRLEEYGVAELGLYTVG